MAVLFVPWVLLVLCVVTLCCLLKRWYVVGCLLLVMMLVVNWHWQVVAFGFQPLPERKTGDGLRVMEWNVDCTNELFDSYADDIYKCIHAYNPDVLFLTEYRIDNHPLLDSLLRADFGYSWSRDNDFTSSVIYSKKAVKDCRFADPTGKWVYIIRACIEVGADSVVVYGGHMASNNISTTPADSVNTLDGVRVYLENYESKTEAREYDANTVVGSFGDNKVIVMGDLNDVWGSLPLKRFAEAGLKDAWWEGGFGYGATIHRPLAYRIDHVLYSDGLTLTGIKKVSANGLSDHDVLVADFKIE